MSGPARPAARHDTAALVLAALPLAVVALPRLGHEWAINANCDHVWLTLPLALWTWWSRTATGCDRTAAAPAPGGNSAAAPDWRAGLPLLALSLLALLGDARCEEEFLLALGLLAGLAAAVALLGGRAALRRAAFPFLLLAFALPLPISLCSRFLHLRLQAFAAATTARLLAVWQPGSVALGTTVVVGERTLAVSEACSGLRGLTALLFLALWLGERWLGGADRRGRLLLALASLPVALATNVARLVVAALLLTGAGEPATEAFLHRGGALPVYALGLLALWALARLRIEWRQDPLRLASPGL